MIERVLSFLNEMRLRSGKTSDWKPAIVSKKRIRSSNDHFETMARQTKRRLETKTVSSAAIIFATDDDKDVNTSRKKGNDSAMEKSNIDGAVVKSSVGRVDGRVCAVAAIVESIVAGRSAVDGTGRLSGDSRRLRDAGERVSASHGRREGRSGEHRDRPQ